MHAARRLVAIEHRRIDARRQRGAQEQRIALERRENDGAELARDRRVLGDLQIALDLRALVPGRCATVDPRVAAPSRRPRTGATCSAVKQLGNADQHGSPGPQIELVDERQHRLEIGAGHRTAAIGRNQRVVVQLVGRG